MSKKLQSFANLIGQGQGKAMVRGVRSLGSAALVSLLFNHIYLFLLRTACTINAAIKVVSPLIMNTELLRGRERSAGCLLGDRMLVSNIDSHEDHLRIEFCS